MKKEQELPNVYVSTEPGAVQAGFRRERRYVLVLGYTLSAVLGGEQNARAFASRVPGARIVLLDEGVALVPLPEGLVGEPIGLVGEPIYLLTHDGNASVPVGERLPEAFQELLRELSVRGPIAYVEASFHGGSGEQAAVVWERGTVVLGPLVEDEADPPPLRDHAINQVLRRLGVRVGMSRADEFETVGLERYRQTEDWHRSGESPSTPD